MMGTERYVLTFARDIHFRDLLYRSFVAGSLRWSATNTEGPAGTAGAAGTCYGEQAVSIPSRSVPCWVSATIGATPISTELSAEQTHAWAIWICVRATL